MQLVSSTACDIMDSNKLRKLRDDLHALRRAQPKARDLQSLAQRLGRARTQRGKHPMWESEPFPELRPLSIPDHKGRDMPRGTKNSILDQLEEDLLAWEQRLEGNK